MRHLILLLVCQVLFAQTGQRLSSPVIVDRITTGTPRPGELQWRNNDGSVFGFRGSLTGTSAVIGLPNAGPTSGTCLGYVSTLQLGWVTCAGGAGYDPTLGVLMVNYTNTGVTGSGDGGHLGWDPTNHWLFIGSFFGGVSHQVIFDASVVEATLFGGNIILATTPTLCPTGFYATGVNTSINAVCGTILDPTFGIFTTGNTTPNATSTADGGHWYWDPTFHLLSIQSWFSGSVAPIHINASEVDSSLYKGNIILTTTPTLCTSGTYARGVDVNINGAGCTIVPDFVNGIFTNNLTNPNVTSTADGMHMYWDTTSHWIQISSWFSGSAAAIHLNGSQISVVPTPSLCSSGNYARGIDTNLNATGCTTAGGGSVDPTLGLIGVNDTNTNTTTTSSGIHLYYDPGTTAGHIRVYNSGSPVVLEITSFLTQFDNVITSQGIEPNIDNLYINGTAANRWSDERSATAHFGDAPLNIPTGTVLQAVSASSPTAVIADAFNNVAAYVTRAAGNSYASPTALGSGVAVGVFGSRGFDGSWALNTNASMVTTTTQAWTGSAHGMKLTFNTTALSQTTAAQRVQIDENGLTVAIMGGGSSRAVCVTSAGLIYAASGTTCP